MSVLDRLTQIQTYWEIALWAGVGVLLVTLVVGTILVGVTKTDKVFMPFYVIIIICAIEVVSSVAGLFISSGQVSKTRYYSGEYNIEQMAMDYNARTIEDDREHNPYLIHYEGYGTEEWVYYIGKPDPQAQYLITN